MKSKRGFTLIEVMITITILGTLTVLVAQAIQQGIKAKIKLQGQIDDVSRMRDTMRLLERDINLAYHYRDFEKEIEAAIKKKNQPAPVPGQPALPPPEDILGQTLRREVPRRDPETHFVGDEEGLNFVTMNNARTVRNTKQADFVEVGYELKDCKSLKEDGGSSKCLWRRTSPYVDLDVTKGGSEVALLENVTEFKLRYIGKGKQDWVNSWRTDQGGDGATKGKFPTAVEVSLTLTKSERGKDKKYSMQIITPIHFPNNPEDKKNAQGTQSGSPTF